MTGILIAAIAENGVIGNCNKLPWERIPEDMSRFRNLTLGHAVLMGRKTYDSLGRPLNNRLNVIVSRDNYAIPNNQQVLTSTSLDVCVEMARKFRLDGKFYVIGGAEVYSQVLAKRFVDKMEITHVHQKPEGDTVFPEVDWGEWRKVASIPREGYEFATYEKR